MNRLGKTVVIGLIFTVITWGIFGGLDAMSSEIGFVDGFIKSVLNIFIYYLWFRSNPDYSIGSFGYEYWAFVFWGILLIISAFVWDKLDSRSDYSIICAKCDQYLGTGKSFRSPCPRCGSNRYSRE